MENKKIKEIFADEALIKELLALETAAEFQAVLQKKGIEMIEADILAIRDMLSKAKMGELTEELLENVAGGTAIINGDFLQYFKVNQNIVATNDRRGI